MHAMRPSVKHALRAEHFDATLPFVEDVSKPGTLSDHIAGELRRHREELRLPYTELAERLARLGRPIPVLGLRRIERGERRVDVDELAALALALGVPPASLMFPTDSATVEVVPGKVLSSWHAATWFTGESAEAMFGTDEPLAARNDFFIWNIAAGPLNHRREQARFIDLWTAARRRADTDPKVLQWIESVWREARAQLRRSGYEPPELPETFAHIDDM